MATDANPTQQPQRRGPAPLSPSVRQRLQKSFERAQSADFEYANQLLTQCVAEDPSNVVYLNAFLANLQKKFGSNKKASTFGSLKIKSHRSALAKAAEKGQWQAAFEAGCAALAVHPWDAATLIGMAQACNTLGIDEAQLTYLKWALGADPKHAEVNRQAAMALQRMGQFDQAIACWHRVEQAKPHDEEALQAISRLSVEKTIHQGGYDPALLGGAAEGDAKLPSVARMSKGAAAEADADDDQPAGTPEQRYQTAIEKDPAEVENYFRLVDLYLHQHRLDDAERTLEQAQAATGGGNLTVRERMEDLQLRRASHQVAAAQKNCDSDPSPEAKQLLDRAKSHANQVELEVFATRVDRDPNNPRLQHELGLRLKRAGKPKQAITALQAARSDPKRLANVLLELGECFQKIEQYKLALAHYEQSIEASESGNNEGRKLALYRAGVLATGLRELDRAERHLAELAGLDYGYRDVSDRLDKISSLRDSG
jgi:tetratricopeptide (TPR) repeat protein